MNVVGIIGLVIGIAILIVFAYRGLGALPLTIFAGCFVILSNRMNLWTAFTENYMGGYLNFFRNYFFIFMASAFYAKVMEESKSAASIGYKFIDWFGAKRAVFVVFMATSVLTFGGVSLFVVVFAIAPIIMLLFKEADVPRRLAMGPLLAGSATFTMTSLPGTPQLTNVIPTRYLGTTMTAAPVFSMFASLGLFLLCYFYLEWEEKRLRKAGEHFSLPDGVDESAYSVNRKELPPASTSFIPLIIIVGMIIGLRNVIKNSAQLVVLAMFIASAVALILNWDRIKDKQKCVSNGFGGAVGAIAGPCAVVGFGSLVQASPAFQTILNWVLSFDMHPYVTGPLATAIISGITGSSSGGISITLEALAPQLVESGTAMPIVHRLMSIAAGSLDSLPHSSALFLMFSHLGITHKEGYRFVFVTTVLVPTIVCIFAVIAALAFKL